MAEMNNNPNQSRSDDKNEVRELNRVLGALNDHEISTGLFKAKLNLRTARQYNGMTDPTKDLPLSALHKIHDAFPQIEIAEMLLDQSNPEQNLARARFVKVVTTVAELWDKNTNKSIQRLLRMLGEQLLDMRPLDEAWIRQTLPWLNDRT